MLGILESIVNFFAHIGENITRLIETLGLLLEAPDIGLSMINEWLVTVTTVVPELAMIAPICVVGVVFIIIDILRDLL